MEKKVLTILGSIAPEELGFTDMHEHVMMDGGWVLRQRYKNMLMQDDRYAENDPVRLDNVGLIKSNFMSNLDALSFDDEEMVLGEVRDYQKSGGKSILELSVPGIRTKVPAIKKIAEQTGAHIIVSTGLYTGDSWPQKYMTMTENELRNYMLDEIKNGIEDTGIKPGHIKIAIHSMMDNEERALRAAARVSNETGLGMTVHCSSGSIGGGGPRTVRILKEEETDVSRVVIAHTGASFGIMDLKLLATQPDKMKLNLDYCKEIMDLGANAGIEFYPMSDQSWLILAGVIALVKQGYSSRMVLGTDTCAKVMTRRYGGDGYCRLTRFGIPKLREFGISDYDIRMMTERNPARILAY